MLRLVVNYGSIRIERQLKMTLAIQRQGKIDPGAVERPVIPGRAPEIVRGLAQLTRIPFERAEIVLCRCVTRRTGNAVAERLLCFRAPAKEVKRNSALIENTCGGAAEYDTLLIGVEGLTRLAE